MSGALETCSRPNVLRTADFTQIPTLSSLKSWPSFQQPSFSGNFSLPRFKRKISSYLKDCMVHATFNALR